MKKYVNPIDRYVEEGISFSDISYLVELFPSPIPKEINGIQIDLASDLFRMSTAAGFSEIFIPDASSINGEIGSKKIKISRRDFIAWQLLRTQPATILWLASKFDANLKELSAYDQIANDGSDGDLEDWLDPHNSNDITMHGCSFIERIKSNSPAKFCELMTSAILDENYGFLSFLETEIHDEIKPIRKLYKDWSEPLMVVSCGNFFPYIEAGEDAGLLMDDYRLRQMFVRNYDEGDI